MEAKMQQAIELSESIAQTTNQIGSVLVYTIKELNKLIEIHKATAEGYENQSAMEMALTHYKVALELDSIVGAVSKQVKEIV